MYQVAEFYFSVKETLDDTLNRYAVFVAKGKKQYFDKIDEKIRPDVIRQTYKYQLMPEDRKDIIQDLMEVAFRNCYKYEPELGNYRHYTNKITKYELMKMYYKIISDNKFSLNKSNYAGTFSAGDYRNKNLADPLDIVIYEEAEGYLLNEKGPCTKLERKVYHYYNQGYNIKEIGRNMGMTEKIVRNSLYRVKIKAMKAHSER